MAIRCLYCGVVSGRLAVSESLGVTDLGNTLVYKILQEHLVEGQLAAGQEIGIRIDQTLTQDATGTTAFLLFESMGVGRVKTNLSVSYVDHNMAGFGPENHNDHLYLQTVAAKSGVYHSRPGNGICHQVHLERFGKPGATLLGSDSHTPTGGGIGMLAIGAGGLDVAVAMGGGPFYLQCPKVLGVKLTGRLGDWVAAKDIILRLLGELTTKGNVGWAVEYFGAGAKNLTVPQRATITNMGAELGVTDERLRQRRADQEIPRGPETRAGLSAAGGGQGCRVRPGHRDRSVGPGADGGLSLLAGQCQTDSRDRRQESRADRGRQLHEFELRRPDDGGAGAQGPADRPDGGIRRRAGQPGSAEHAGGERGLGGPDRRRGAHPRIGVRAVHRAGLLPRRRHREPADVQPQLRRPDRHQGRPGLLGQPRDGGRLRPDRRRHRPARPVAARWGSSIPRSRCRASSRSTTA